MPDETPDERRTRHLADYDHTHDPLGHPIVITPLQDANGDNCTECGRTIIARHDFPKGEPETWQHETSCSLYEPHPNSIASQA